MRRKSEVWVYSIVSGLFLMGANAFSIVVPLRMADQTLSYSSIGGALASLSFGVLFIKIIFGRRSDIVGQKRYLTISLAGSIGISILMIFARSVTSYMILLALFGVFRGMFTSVHTSYMIDITDEESRGKGIGNILSISTFLSSIGGILTGVLYGNNQGAWAFVVISVLLLVGLILCVSTLPDIQKEQKKLFSKELFLQMDRKILLFCLIMFCQTFVTSPLWNTLIPLHFYVKFGFSAVVVGIFMSLDEIVGSLVYIPAGHIVDKYPIRKTTFWGYLLVAITSIIMYAANHSYLFLFGFLLSGIFITLTYVAIPVAQSHYLRDDAKGFELALIAMSASLGDILGNIAMSKIIDVHSMGLDILLFASVNFFISLLTLWMLKDKKTAKSVEII
ncbi:MAG: MFS transporter [Clostridiales bacterium]|nr:MFS transporter [Clostridiales bacterium]